MLWIHLSLTERNIHNKFPEIGKGVRCVPLADFVMDEIILQRQRYEELRSNFSDFLDLGYLFCRENGVVP